MISREPFGAKPTVLRCARCGRFVDWEEASLQVVCGCRPRLSLPPVMVRQAEENEQQAVLDLFARDFGRASIVAFGEVIPLDHAAAIVADMKGEIAGALAYRILPGAVQIVALATDPMWQRSGVGGHLVAEIELIARGKGLNRLVFATTNDNLPALYFYQRRGYQITEVVPGGLLAHLKEPNSTGFGGIPLRDEIRLAKSIAVD